MWRVVERDSASLRASRGERHINVPSEGEKGRTSSNSEFEAIVAQRTSHLCTVLCLAAGQCQEVYVRALVSLRRVLHANGSCSFGVP